MSLTMQASNGKALSVAAISLIATAALFLLLATTTTSVRFVEAADDTEARVQQLVDLSERRPVIKLNLDKFRKFIDTQSQPRNYSFIVMMTALNPQRSCQICRQAQDEYLIAAQSFKLSHHFDARRLFFGFVDYDDGSEVFNTLGINSAPCFLYFGHDGNVKKPDELNIQRLGFGADVIGRWVEDRTKMSFKIVRPPNFSGPILIGALVIVTISILYASRHSLTMIFNRNFWAFAAVMIVLFMTSGQMWNNIRGAPFMQRSGRNQVSYIHNSSSGQYVIETYIVMLVNAGIAFGMVLATDAMRLQTNIDSKRKRVCVIVGLGLMILSFSILLSTFRRKSYGYPYRLLF